MHQTLLLLSAEISLDGENFRVTNFPEKKFKKEENTLTVMLANVFNAVKNSIFKSHLDLVSLAKHHPLSLQLLPRA